MSVAIVVSRSSSSVTPAGAVTAASVTVSLISSGGHVVLDRVGDVGRQRLDVELARDLLEHAAGLHAGRVVGAGQLEHDDGVDLLSQVDAQQVDVHRLARDRVALLVLDHDRRLALALDRERDDGAAVGERLAQRARVDLEARSARPRRRRRRRGRGRCGAGGGSRGSPRRSEGRR